MGAWSISTAEQVAAFATVNSTQFLSQLKLPVKTPDAHASGVWITGVYPASHDGLHEVPWFMITGQMQMSPRAPSLASLAPSRTSGSERRDYSENLSVHSSDANEQEDVGF